MRKTLIAIALLATTFFTAQAQEMTAERQKLISTFISNVKQQNKEALAAKVKFPLRRDAPIPPIKTKEEFLARYNEIFDESLTKMIVSSLPDKNWTVMGWRGMMLDQGKVWLDDAGTLIAVNYQSTIEKRKQKSLIKDDKKQLNSNVKKYSRPVCLLETKTHRIRIDDLGHNNFRYSSWRLQTNTSEKPDLMMEDGELTFEGTGGNRRYDFQNDGHLYTVTFTELGVDDKTPVVLTISKDGKALSTQQATVIR